MNFDSVIADLDARTAEAVAFYWQTRQRQASKEAPRDKSTQGRRPAVTGGAQMDRFLEFIADYLIKVGIPPCSIHFESRLELPGFFRPTKKWDLVVVKNDQLLVALEAKSQVGSFGNNFNNRTEEAMGSALDLWTAFRERAFNPSVSPWLGYLFLLQDCEASRRAVMTEEPHFPVFPEFKNSSYATRYEWFCRKLVRERHYTASAFLLSKDDQGRNGQYTQPASDLTIQHFMRSLLGHAIAHV
ncbi:PaeR7I family type II restriction endonuclease [Fontisphaera persica]|uniref:PaeR7I family type II restriction endonuclease n=1 Tax=Fontisphaera persica TaxID=2974023 RepID=UPI0024C04CA2|nr:PaeR7I family type II restriction endonuclease [Fontisphaera persica]WCJ58572.1 PaeR7I family type II restriction endonuclease [Fontisphaera persica]